MGDKYDDTLFEILKDTKTLPNFFDTIFGFLYRRTDFYQVTNDPNLGVGLPPGLAEKYIKQAYFKYVNKRDILKSPQPKQVPVPVNEVVIKDTPDETETKPDVVNSTKSTTNVCESYNGASYDIYSWTQSITDVDVQVNLPKKFNTKQLSVNITPTNITVKSKNSEGIFLDGELCQKCKHQETTWSIDGNTLQIHLEKVKECWWDCLVTTEKRLDLSKMDCSRPFHELSEEAQAKIEELMWNQERKRQGLPTSEDLKLEKTLKQAWNASGSPFTGEYDPSKIQFS